MNCDILQATEQEIAPELQLIGELLEVGIIIPTRSYGSAVAVLSEWILRHQAATQVRAFDQRQAISILAAYLSQGYEASPEMAGYRLYCLAHRAKLGNWKTQTELANRIDVSPGRASQLLTALDDELNNIMHALPL